MDCGPDTDAKQLGADTVACVGPGVRLRTALESLTEPHRLVFELAVVQSRPYAEIAEELGIPVGTVKSRVFNALRKLRAALEEEKPRR